MNYLIYHKKARSAHISHSFQYNQYCRPASLLVRARSSPYDCTALLLPVSSIGGGRNVTLVAAQRQTERAYNSFLLDTRVLKRAVSCKVKKS